MLSFSGLSRGNRLALLLLLASIPAFSQANTPSMSLIDLTAPDAMKQLTPVLYGSQTNPKGTVIQSSSKGLEVHFPPHQPGDYDHPGFTIVPKEGKAWDLSAYGHMETKVMNTGAKVLPIVMQVEDGSGGLNNLESIDIKPGETKVLKVVFGYQYQYEADSPINLKNITNILIFCWGGPDQHDFVVEELKAAGSPGEKPEVDPAKVRYRPQGGVVLSNGTDKVSNLKPPIGMWDLSQGNELRVRLRNKGKSAVTPMLELMPTQGDRPFTWQGQQLIAAGTEAETTFSFLTAETGFNSDSVHDISITAASQTADIIVESIVLDTASEDVAASLGGKPPVDGDWTPTFDEEFSGPALDYKKWNIYGAESLPFNYFWDRNHNPRHIVHFSKDNLLLADGKAILRLDKKVGRLNDDPNGAESDYASTLLTTYGKWTQRYGYFEARLKLPAGLGGLWSSFSLVPDRGKSVQPKASRISLGKLPADAGVGGTEFDVMDNYSVQGPDRLNATVLVNKSLGTASPYIKPDRDGFITVGLLWLPGQATVYYNGKQALHLDSPRIGDVQASIKFDLLLGGANKLRDEGLTFPDDLIVDYVRVWQRKDLATPQDGPKPNAGDPNENKN
jgi:beta-glucanase (GH16 family)